MEGLSQIACIKNPVLKAMMDASEIGKKILNDINLKISSGNGLGSEKPVEGAPLGCTSALKGDTVYVFDDDGEVYISGRSTLTKKNTILSGSFQYCQYSPDKKCPEKREIEADEWKGYDEGNKAGIDREELDVAKSYMVCLTGCGVIYFTDSGQEAKEFAEDFAVLNRYVNEKVFEAMGWNMEIFKKTYKQDAVEKLKEYMYQYKITDSYSVCMFLATIGTESDDGSKLLEDRKNITNATYVDNTKGAGLIQVTGFDQKAFLEYIKGEMEGGKREDAYLYTEIKDKYLRGYPPTYSKITIGGEEYDICENSEDVASFIAEHYPIESAAWYWGEYKKCTYWNDVSIIYEDTEGTPETITLDQYIRKITEKLDVDSLVKQQDTPLEYVFLATQYYVNGNRWFRNRIQKIAECMDDTYKIGTDQVTFTLPPGDPKAGYHFGDTPNGWQGRADDWKQMAYELFG